MSEISGRSLPRAHYSDEEVKAILEVALGFDGKDFTRVDLVTMAQQLGISEAQLESAENTYFQRIVEQNEKSHLSQRGVKRYCKRG